MNNQLFGSISPYHAQHFEASPFQMRLRSQASNNFQHDSNFHYPLNWSIMKKDNNQNFSVMKSPVRNSGSLITPQSSKFKLTLQKTPMMSIDEYNEQITQVSSFNKDGSRKSSASRGFRSSKLLNFGSSAKEQGIENNNPNISNDISNYNNKVTLFDVLGQNNHMLSPMDITFSNLKKNPSTTSQQTKEGGKSPNIKPFLGSKPEPLGNNKVPSTASHSAETISEEDSMISPIFLQKTQSIAQRNPIERYVSQTQLNKQQSHDEQFLMSKIYENYQNFQYDSPAPKNNQHMCFEDTPNFHAYSYSAQVPQFGMMNTEMKKPNQNKNHKCKTISQKKKQNKKLTINKREQKSETKKQTLYDKLITKKQQSPIPKAIFQPIVNEVVINKTDSTAKKTEEEKEPVRKCTCSKSRCLKLYCECFANGQVCGIDCGCKDCCNNEESSELIQQAKDEIMKRDPNAFKAKATEDTLGKRVAHRKGCTCKKSGCLKGYCECFQLGVACTEACKCTGCANCEGRGKDDKGASSHSTHNHHDHSPQNHSNNQKSNKKQKK